MTIEYDNFLFFFLIEYHFRNALDESIHKAFQKFLHTSRITLPKLPHTNTAQKTHTNTAH